MIIIISIIVIVYYTSSQRYIRKKLICKKYQEILFAECQTLNLQLYSFKNYNLQLCQEIIVYIVF